MRSYYLFFQGAKAANSKPTNFRFTKISRYAGTLNKIAQRA